MIKIKNVLHQEGSLEVKDIVRDNYDTKRNAFYGKTGDGPVGIYLVTYDSVVWLLNPFKTWGGSSSVTIMFWIDLEFNYLPSFEES